jgi:hypothetical protein
VLPDAPLAAREALLARLEGRAAAGRFARGPSTAIGF